MPVGLRSVMEELAKLIIRDGEGATKLVTIETVGARTTEDAKAVCWKKSGLRVTSTHSERSIPLAGSSMSSTIRAVLPLSRAATATIGARSMYWFETCTANTPSRFKCRQ